MIDRFLRRGALIVIVSLPLGACFDVVAHPLNHEPTAYEDSQCPKAPPSQGPIVNYGCARQ